MSVYLSLEEYSDWLLARGLDWEEQSLDLVVQITPMITREQRLTGRELEGSNQLSL